MYVSETFNSNENDNPVTNLHATQRLRIILPIKKGLTAERKQQRCDHKSYLGYATEYIVTSCLSLFIIA